MTNNDENILEIKNIKKSFGNKFVHQGVSFDLKKGEVLSLIGGSGCGKSVLLRSIIGLETPDSGSIKFHGTELLNRNETQWVDTPKRIPLVFQYAPPFHA